MLMTVIWFDESILTNQSPCRMGECSPPLLAAADKMLSVLNVQSPAAEFSFNMAVRLNEHQKHTATTKALAAFFTNARKCGRLFHRSIDVVTIMQ